MIMNEFFGLSNRVEMNVIFHKTGARAFRMRGKVYVLCTSTKPIMNIAAFFPFLIPFALHSCCTLQNCICRACGKN